MLVRLRLGKLNVQAKQSVLQAVSTHPRMTYTKRGVTLDYIIADTRVQYRLD
jgi:hypothetical protein